MATIITKNSSTAGAVPIAGDLVQGEIAVNVTDKKLYTKNASGTVVQITPTVNDNGFKNRIINGAMVIDQRNVGASLTITADPQYTVDRWKVGISQASKVSVQRSSTAPVGFTNSALLTSLSAMTIGASDYAGFQQDIEGFNVADLGWGTASAQSVTIGFWIRCSLTGTFSGALRNQSQTRSYPFTFTINSANTWEYKTVTVAGDQSGTWATDNTSGLRLNFNISAGSNYLASAGSWVGSNVIGATGSVNLLATNGATLYITGVQLEKGSTATSFDYRPYGTELALCERYYKKQTDGFSGVCSAASAITTIQFNTTMRSAPTVTSISNGTIVDGVSGYATTGVALNGSSYVTGVRCDFTSSGLTAGRGAVVVDAAVGFSAEL